MKFTSTLSIISFGFANLAMGLTILPGANIRTSGPSARRVDARQGDSSITITCTNNTVDYVEAQTAAIDLGNFCSSEGSIHGWTKSSKVDAKTRVYVCNWAQSDRTCNHDEIVRAQNAIASKCGLNRSGVWYNADTMKSYGMEKTDVAYWCEGLEEHDSSLIEA
ncbi:hypothetical protein QBC37DRAFT_428929 [Rhypophila decipiens]|uniref:Ecp2 effector protein domain-containing protein n=1 Tax=Rhypophila decipiens TaxID=261697 RepID=A0AAN6Y2X2_9PEZI|nr:hypothetical protein QBC37DRAFT_428929 [Rhypophila decipiens]